MLKFIHKFLSSPICTSNIVAITKDKVFLENNVYKSTLVFTIALDLIQLCWSCNLWGTMWNQSWKWVTSDTQTQPHKFPRLKSALDKCHWGTLYGWRGSAQLFAGFRVQVVFSICQKPTWTMVHQKVRKTLSNVIFEHFFLSLQPSYQIHHNITIQWNCFLSSSGLYCWHFANR